MFTYGDLARNSDLELLYGMAQILWIPGGCWAPQITCNFHHLELCSVCGELCPYTSIDLHEQQYQFLQCIKRDDAGLRS